MVHPGNPRAGSLKPSQSGVRGDFRLRRAARRGDVAGMVNALRLLLLVTLGLSSALGA